MDKFTSIVVPTYFQFIQMPTIETKVWYNSILTYYAMKGWHGGLKFGRKKELLSDHICNIINP